MRYQSKPGEKYELTFFGLIEDGTIFIDRQGYEFIKIELKVEHYHIPKRWMQVNALSLYSVDYCYIDEYELVRIKE